MSSSEKMVTITVDGKQVHAEAGEHLLDVLQTEGVKVPSLCHHRAIIPYSSCRLCLVEVTANDRTTITTSCNYKVVEGLEVDTTSKEVKDAQRMGMELLLARCPNSVELRAYAKEMGIEGTRFKTRTKEETECILCGLCVRVCQEVMNIGAIGFANRGEGSKVTTPMERFSNVCHSCGACEFLCPTNCIDIEKISGKRPKMIASEFDAELRSRGSIYIPFPQAVPNQPVIDKETCMYYLTGHCKVCEKFCTANAISYDQSDEILEKRVGSIILSPGFDEYEPPEGGAYGYKVFPNVLTSIQFERMLSASGPYEGHIKRLSDGKEPKKIAWLQCVGSRDEKCNRPYCSSVCCMYATKEAVIAKEHQPGVDTHIYFMDMRTFGKDFEKYYNRAKDEYGVIYRRSRIPSVEQDQATKDLLIRYVGDDGRPHEEYYDMVVLSVGLQPCDALEDLGKIVDINLDQYGFVDTDPFIKTLTSKKGVYASGTATSPMDIPESVTQASAAAAEAVRNISDVRGTQIVEKEYPKERDVHSEAPRIGVIVCNCGINISGVVDVERVVKVAEKLPDVVYASGNLYTCSQDSLVGIKEKIVEMDLNRVVIASCTPRTHEVLFHDTLREAGLNPHLFEMANIRDQNSWVHKGDPNAATEKAIDAVKMAASKASKLYPVLHSRSSVVPNALVLGGGIAGMSSALAMADQGFTVFLVEKERELGGHLKHIYLGVDGEEPQKLLADTIDRVGDHPNIDVFTSTEIGEISGYTGNFTSRLRSSEGDIQEVQHGVIVVATGGLSYEPVEYEYGKSERIITQRDLEKELFDDSPYLKDLKEMVMIQCVGSRNEERPYCSRVCCSNAIKNALKVKQRNPHANVYVLYRDIRTYGFHEDKLFSKARKKGVIFIRFDEGKEPEVEVKDGQVVVRTYDNILGRDMVFKPDRLVLSTGIVSGDNSKISQQLKLPLNEDGFFIEAHVKLRPVDFATEGVYLCGLAHSPRFIDEAILQANATAARAATILSKEHLETIGSIANIRSRNCAGCRLCVDICSFDALSFDEDRKIAVVNEIICQGCGACAAVCPSGVMQQNTFTKKQILSMIDTCLEV